MRRGFNRDHQQQQHPVAGASTTSDDAGALHPSWAAKKLLKDKLAYTKTVPEGKKIVFSDAD